MELSEEHTDISEIIKKEYNGTFNSLTVEGYKVLLNKLKTKINENS